MSFRSIPVKIAKIKIISKEKHAKEKKKHARNIVKIKNMQLNNSVIVVHITRYGHIPVS